MNERMRYFSKLGMLTVLSPLRMQKIHRNRVILNNCLAHNYADNIKPIADRLAKEYPGKLEIFVAVDDPGKFEYLKEKGITPIKIDSPAYYKVAMSSAFYVTNSGGYSYLPLKKGQYVINTWHGGGAYKKIGMDAYRVGKYYEKDLRLTAKKTSVFLASSKMFADLLSPALLIPRDKFREVGLPRNDILVKNDPDQIRSIRQKLGISEDEKLVLYAPTYRRPNDDSFGQSIAIDYGIDPERVCKALSQRFGGKWRFAMRLHPQIKETVGLDPEKVLDLTKYDDMQELLLAADVMINDFSSSMWDFMLTGKPSFLYAKDLQHYIETTAVYTPVSEWPFPKSTNNDELEKSILEFDETKYGEDCDAHYKHLGGCETGRAAEYVCKYIAKRAKIDKQKG